MDRNDAQTSSPVKRPPHPIPDAKAKMIYKFLKKSGRNYGPLKENEERDRRLYDYSDEL
jgi:hypothetical protein